DGLGSPSRVLSRHFRVEVDARHNMRRDATDRRIAAYLLSPRRGWRDLSTLAGWARGYDLVVNDSLHPALLLAPWVMPGLPVLQVYGENLRRAAEANLDGRVPRPLSVAYQRLLTGAFDRSFGQIVHCVGAPLPPLGGPIRLPTLVPAFGDAPREQGRVAVYLNPHFRDPRIAEAIERALPPGSRLYGVAEGYAGRTGWRARDPALARVVAGADVFISGAGMGALELARSTGTPLLCVLGAQPEQERNAEAARRALPPGSFATVSADEECLAPKLAGLLPSLRRFAPPISAEAIGRAWREAFETLLHPTPKETRHDAVDRVGAGNSQPERRRRRPARRGQPGAPARTSEEAGASAR
ncbi:MAG TPA: hypothetical protein VH208_14015, partial [Myxococcaceae bacterium]|nr:hypothetical protein [Myxococcaceae bacterium]